MIGYPIVFRCCECTVEEQTMEHLEKHIWSRHLQAFPFKCAQCDFPAINSTSLREHFEQLHQQVTTIEFKRNLEDEKRFRKMIAESIAIEIEDNSQPTQQLTVLQPMAIPQGTTQIMLMPSTSSQYEAIVEHRGADEDDFGVLEDDENVEEMMDEEDEDFLDELGNPVFIGASDDPEYILEDEMAPPIRPTSYHMKYLRTRRMDKLIDNVVVNATQRSSPDSTTNQPNGALLLEGSSSRSDRKYSCDQCNKSFQYMSKLEEHRRIHMGVKPYSCPYCPRQFTQKGALKTHIRLHTGERPFACQWECGREFTSASARTHHEKTHSGERPYQCSVCGKAFTKNSHVLRHLKNIHNRDMLSRAALISASGQSGGDIGIPPVPDVTPRGKEAEVVHEIVVNK
uniref:C2H2-type domain-containing protein n=1 Tax=Caenorhabditis japonica TaxID=281687 RepID=A0A8R1HLA0_CAEJA